MSVSASDPVSGLLLALANSARRKETMEAMGLAVASLARRAFREPALRPAPWPARKTPGSHQLLRKSGTLWRSIRVSDATPTTVSLSSDRVYANIHQFGGVILPKSGQLLAFPWGAGGPMVFAKKVTIPARPFFPFDASGEITARGRKAVEGAIAIKLRKYGIITSAPAE